VFRDLLHGALSFLLCCAALTGLYLLLNLHFVAAIQLTIGTALTALVVLLGSTMATDGVIPRPRVGYLIGVLPFVVIAFAAIYRGSIGDPVLTLPPTWAARGESIPSLGRMMSDSFTVVFGLVGLMLFTSIVGIAYLFQEDKTEP
jgi:NADH:ubiquinone oxidoreductase subunit 6 (subunit J)